MKFTKTAIVDVLGITKEAEEEIKLASDNTVIFPTTDPSDETEISKRIDDADAIFLSWRTTLPKTALDNAKNLKYIGVTATSMANIDLDEVKRRRITITNVTDYGDEATAEYIFTQLLNLLRGIGSYQWREMPSELNGKTIGIVGLGAVGVQVARLALGFNMHVLYFSRTRKPEWEKKGLIYATLPDLITKSEIVSLHVPKNTYIFTEKEFALLTPEKILVTTCLGKVYDNKLFIEWISKEQNYAIFDYSVDSDYYNAFKDLKNVIFPQIIAGRTKESKERLSNKVVSNMKLFLHI